MPGVSHQSSDEKLRSTKEHPRFCLQLKVVHWFEGFHSVEHQNHSMIRMNGNSVVPFIQIPERINYGQSVYLESVWSDLVIGMDTIIDGPFLVVVVVVVVVVVLRLRSYGVASHRHVVVVSAFVMVEMRCQNLM